MALALLSALPVAGSPRRQEPPAPAPAVQIMRDIVYGTGGGRPLRMHILRPEPLPKEPLPVIVWVHGGGWLGGSRNDGLRFLPKWAERGYLCASIDYRLSNQALFPAQIEDCKCAVRYLRAHARELHLDPERIGAWGSSAGGHLVALLGTTGDVKEFEGKGGWQEHSSRVQAVCDWYGPTDFLKMLEFPSVIHHEAANSPEARLIGGPVRGNREKVERANPIAYVGRETRTRDIPPFLIMHGDRDRTVPLNQSEILYEALKQAGVTAELRIVKGGGHGFGGPAVEEPVEAFFAVHLKGRRPGTPVARASLGPERPRR